MDVRVDTETTGGYPRDLGKEESGVTRVGAVVSIPPMVTLSYSPFVIVVNSLSCNFSSMYSPSFFSSELSFPFHKFSGAGVQSPGRHIFLYISTASLQSIGPFARGNELFGHNHTRSVHEGVDSASIKVK